MARQAERKAAHRAAILDAAEELLAISGEVVAIEAIAARAGLAKGTVYNHFADKDALLRAVARRVREAAAARVAAAVSDLYDAPSRIACGMNVYLALARDDPHRGAILVRLVQDAIDPGAPLNAALLSEIERGNARGEFDARPPHAGVAAVLAMLHAAMSLLMGSESRPPNADAAHAMVRLVLMALTGGTGPRSLGDPASL